MNGFAAKMRAEGRCVVCGQPAARKTVGKGDTRRVMQLPECGACYADGMRQSPYGIEHTNHNPHSAHHRFAKALGYASGGPGGPVTTGHGDDLGDP